MAGQRSHSIQCDRFSAHQVQGRSPGTSEITISLQERSWSKDTVLGARGPAVSQFLLCSARGGSEAVFPNSFQSANHLKNPKRKIYDGEISPVLAARHARSSWHRHSTK